ncbi:hypothetical protein JAO76_05780 [Pontibacter sp. BT310]|uniref:Uncharacterized protein n=1 Tax=Pontibacter populi TaxID=890055 RepID=A0ABS6X9H8_9BACT|nr:MULTISPECIES: hypothetical protein [Pontibacter]MBJ6117689.1 hypothetical protein [Pontibacter sp. BT310]MBR0570115.1 hypothetical protein [Microvirga sp. STS03]MBW3364541.1 hypothetical protein [Pontibacter populi]
MRNYSLVLVGSMLLAVAACEQPVPRSTSANDDDYNLTAYVQQEKQRLQQAQPAVLKSVQTESEPTETIQVDSLNWDEELTVFEEADISKPTLREYYTREEQQLPDGGTAVTYIKKKDAEAPVEYLYLQLSPERKVQYLEATLLDQNLLFYSRRKAILEASPQSGHLESYKVQGVQKLIFGDSLHYSVQANL